MTVLRRSFALVLAGLVVVGVSTGGVQAAQSWDGTWAGGWEAGDGVQIIVAGEKVIGVFRGGDYPDVRRSQLSTDGRTLTFAWAGGEGVLQRIDERDATFTLNERGKAERKFPVHRE